MTSQGLYLQHVTARDDTKNEAFYGLVTERSTAAYVEVREIPAGEDQTSK